MPTKVIVEYFSFQSSQIPGIATILMRCGDVTVSTRYAAIVDWNSFLFSCKVFTVYHCLLSICVDIILTAFWMRSGVT